MSVMSIWSARVRIAWQADANSCLQIKVLVKETVIVYLTIAMKVNLFAKRGRAMDRFVVWTRNVVLSCVLDRYVSRECSKSGQFATEIRTVK